jgi:hypothetical protein
VGERGQGTGGSGQRIAWGVNRQAQEHLFAFEIGFDWVRIAGVCESIHFHNPF